MMRKSLFILTIFISAFLMSSCSLNISLQMLKDGSVSISFEGGAGQAFTQMLLSAAGISDVDNGGGTDPSKSSSQSTNVLNQNLDLKEIEYELAKAGFTNIESQIQGTSSVRVNMRDPERTSYIFSSGLVSQDKDQLKLNISRKALVDFYNSADQQTAMILDLFIAPVFNDEEMTEAEYIEMLATFYGQDAADEVRDSFINITLKNLDGKVTKEKLPLSRLLCQK